MVWCGGGEIFIYTYSCRGNGTCFVGWFGQNDGFPYNGGKEETALNFGSRFADGADGLWPCHTSWVSHGRQMRQLDYI